MSKHKTRFTIILLIFLFGVAATRVFLFKGEGVPQQNAATPVVQEGQGLRLMIPDARWEPFFFRSLNEHTEKVNLPSLRTVLLSEDDFEIRFWFDGLPRRIDGIIIRHSAGQWSALELRWAFDRAYSQMQQETLAAPKSGWEAAWGRLVSAGILTLPDATEVQCQSGTLDGIGYVVEINKNRTYRTYSYSNPQFAECNEARQIIEISEIIADEFDLGN